MNRFNESHVEEAALAWLREAGWRVARGPDIASDMACAERREFGDAVLMSRFRAALARLSTTVSGWVSKTSVGRREFGTLATLLLMLISGEPRINDASRITNGG